MKHNLVGRAAQQRRVVGQHLTGPNSPRNRLRAARSGIIVAATAATIAGLAISVAPSYGATPASPTAWVHAKPVPSPVPARHGAHTKPVTPKHGDASPIPKPVHASPIPEPVHASPIPEPVHASPIPRQIHASPAPKPVFPSPAPRPVPAKSSTAAPAAASGGFDPVRARHVSATSRAIEHGDRSALEFVAADKADVARGERTVDCLRAKGVAIVDLGAPDDEGIRYLEFGGKNNDRRSISLGLRYADACIASAAR